MKVLLDSNTKKIIEVEFSSGYKITEITEGVLNIKQDEFDVEGYSHLTKYYVPGLKTYHLQIKLPYSDEVYTQIQHHFENGVHGDNITDFFVHPLFSYITMTAQPSKVEINYINSVKTPTKSSYANSVTDTVIPEVEVGYIKDLLSNFILNNEFFSGEAMGKALSNLVGEPVKKEEVISIMDNPKRKVVIE